MTARNTPRGGDYRLQPLSNPACATDPELWEPLYSDPRPGGTAARIIAEQKQVCRACPDLAVCRDNLAVLPPGDRPRGIVYAGVYLPCTTRERPKCAVDGCRNFGVAARQMCSTHYYRWLRGRK